MLQQTESIETTPTDVSSLAPAATETVSADAEALAQNLDAELAELTACLEAGIERNKRRAWTFQKINLSISIASIVGVLAWADALIYALQHTRMLLDSLPTLMIALAAIIVVPFTVQFSMIALLKGKVRNTEQELSAAKRLLQLDDVRAIGPILDTIEPKAMPLRSMYGQALGRLLPRMTEVEFQQLGPKRHAGLAAIIQIWDNPVHGHAYTGGGTPFLTEVLHRMAPLGMNSFQIGQPPLRFTVSLLPTLGKWADGKGSGQDPMVQQAAVACREAIQQKMELARSGEQLLRSSSPTPADVETLLRPTQGTQQTDPQELLRPGDPK